MQCLRDQFEECNFQKYITSDHPPRDEEGRRSGMSTAEMDIDLCAIPFPDSCFNLFIASHVLDAIRDDRQAIGEICRILEPKGTALLVVPIYPNWSTTLVDPPESLHYWRCGEDYYERYREVGFAVEIIRGSDFEACEEMRLGDMNEQVTICKK